MPVKVPLTTRPAQGLSFWLIQSPQGTTVMVQVGHLTRTGFQPRQRAMRRTVVRAPDLSEASLAEVLKEALVALQAALDQELQGPDTPG